MTLITRLTLILALFLAIAASLFAQETSTTSTTAETSESSETPATTARGDEAVEPISSFEVRNQFGTVLRQHPYEVGTILAMDPTLLQNEEFLSGYPQISKFVKEHPELHRNPRFYLAEFTPSHERGRGMVSEILEGLFVLFIFCFIAFALSLFIRTVVEQKRWSRLSKTQTEVHNKILDRFSSSEELLTYIKTEAGTKFLESAPIPLRAEPPAQQAPLTRIMWSVQVGVVVAAGSLGMILVSNRFEKEAAQELFAAGMIGFTIGVGFILSAFVAMMLSRKLGLWKDPDAAAADSGLVR